MASNELPTVIGPKNRVNPALLGGPGGFLSQKEHLLDYWSQTRFKDRIARDTILDAMHRLGVRPTEWIRERDIATGIYPNISDPEFAARLSEKTEFAMLASDAPSDAVCTNTCDEKKGTRGAVRRDDVFDTTPVQRLVARFLHPTTPYRGLLLNHGVGVGKTCSAVTVAEMFLDYLPNRTVYILAPQAIAEGFRKTIFDVTKLVHTQRDEFALTGERWKSPQCTGMTYLRLTSMEAEPNKEVIDAAVKRLINSRYKIMGYLAFAKMMQNKYNEAPKPVQDNKARFDEYKKKKIIELFTDHLMIVDEAHNLRDEKEGAAAAPVDIDMEDPSAISDAEAGKQLTPILKEIVSTAEGLRLMLMTATPMYNKVTEILFLLRLLLANDANDANVFETKLRMSNVFDLRKRRVDAEDVEDESAHDDFGGALTKEGKEELIDAIKRYVSYMRGENPNTFPIRIIPPTSVGVFEPDFYTKETYPQHSISKKEGLVELNGTEVKITQALPLVITHASKETAVGSLMSNTISTYMGKNEEDEEEEDEEEEENTPSQSGGARKGKKGETTILYKSVQMGNITYSAEKGIYGNSGWTACFATTQTTYGETQVTQYKWKQSDFTAESVFQTNLSSHAPKIARIVESVNKCQGLSFIFSQFVGGGALPIAAALEMNGWCRVLSDGTPAPLLASTRPERATKFYILLTSSKGLAPDFKGLLRYGTQLTCDTAEGPFINDKKRRVQAIIGSQITSEGLDLKCIRELHVLDAWYHLNRIEQIIGRGVRFCSHSLLPVEKRNCSIYLHALAIPEYETADLYAYRLAVKKARYVGEVSRLMKLYAWDCSLNMNAILLPGKEDRELLDSHGNTVKITIGDINYSSLCDYAECPTRRDWCPAIPTEGLDESTYRDFDFRRLFIEKQAALANFFSDDVAHPLEFIKTVIYGDIPWSIGAIGLREALGSLRLKRNDGIYGTLVLKNGYVVFQPDGVTEEDTIPSALRYGRAYGHLTRAFIPDHGIFTSTVPVLPMEVPAPAPAPEPSVDKDEPEPPRVLDRDAANEDAVNTDTIANTAISAIINWRKTINSILDTPKGPIPKPERSIPEKGFVSLRWVISWLGHLPIPGIRDDVMRIATTWFIDNLLQNDEVIALMKTLFIKRHEGLDMSVDETYILKCIESDMSPHGSMVPGFIVFNTKSMELESYCYFEHEFKLCDPRAKSILLESLPAGVRRGEAKKGDEESDVSAFFGILVQIRNDLTFKLVDKKGGSATGTVCTKPSALATHRDRLRKFYSQIPKSSPMHTYLFTDVMDTKGDKVVDKERSELQVKLEKLYKSTSADDVRFTDISHLIVTQVCIYMDFLLRWFDLHKTDDKRWFLRLTESARSGIAMSK